MCTPLYTPMSREVSARYPPMSREPARFWDISFIWLSAVFSTDTVLSVLLLIMTGTVLWDGLVTEACGRSILRSI